MRFREEDLLLFLIVLRTSVGVIGAIRDQTGGDMGVGFLLSSFEVLICALDASFKLRK